MNALVWTAAGLCLCGFAFFWRVPLCRSGRGTLKGTPNPAARTLPLVVIVPARNEAASLPRLLDSLWSGPAIPQEIVVVDDHSQDGTAQVAAERGATVLAGAALPDGWTGKTWACHQGAERAGRQTLLFLDADTWIEPGGLGRLWDEFEAGEGVLSVLPFHRIERPYERLSAFFNLAMAAGVNAFGPRGDRAKGRALFGQCLMLRADDYWRAGGHEAVRGRILENVELAKRFQAAGVGTRCRGGKWTLSFRMYPGGLAELVRGWVKAFASGAATTPLLTLALIIAWMAAGVLAPVPLVHALSGRGELSLPAALPYALFAAQVAVFLGRLGRYGVFTALLYPIPLVFYLVVFAVSAAKAARGGPVAWKGRSMGAGGHG
ncbi:MAG: glycosyltransferase [Deltaproteobacteria bacterium]|nr:glycosyltransferase [Deltaproteobacteria bacterium]